MALSLENIDLAHVKMEAYTLDVTIWNPKVYLYNVFYASNEIVHK